MQAQFVENIDLSIIILCYKSGESIRLFVDKIILLMRENGISEYELVLVGNYIKHSDDATPQIVVDIARTNDRIKFSAEEKGGMMGWDMKCGLSLASGKYISVIDGDGQMLVEDIPRVYNYIKKNSLDLVATYRIHRGDNYWRKIISFFYNSLFHILFPSLKVRDINSKPKIFTREAYGQMDLKSDDWFIDAEIMIQARRYHFKIGELPTVFLGLSGRRSFVRLSAILEFLKNLLVYRIKEFFIR